jgi:hypothetical protein
LSIFVGLINLMTYARPRVSAGVRAHLDDSKLAPKPVFVKPARKRAVACPVLARTPSDASYFFGFHDVSPWSPDDEWVLLHRYRGNPRILDGEAAHADIVLWQAVTNEIREVGHTTIWNMQQGARALWVPGGSPRLAFNRIVDGRAGAELVDLRTATSRTLPFTIGAVAPNGTFALSPHFGRLGRYWRAYGYQGLADVPGIDDPAPGSDGIWRLDLETGSHALLIPIASLPGARAGADATRFATHVSFNRSGSRIVFFEREISRDGGLFSRFFCARPDGTEVNLLAEEKVTHFDWLDDDTLVVWMRQSMLPIKSARQSGLLANPALMPLVKLARLASGRLKGALLKESYYELNVEKPTSRKAFEPALFSEDGHPQVSPDRRWIAIDTYPDRQGSIDVMLYDRRDRCRIDIAQFQTDESILDGDYKCDFHPRWNRAGTQIAGDVSRGGRRGLVIIDAEPALRSAA